MARRWLRDTHWQLVTSMFALMGMGILFIYSASNQAPVNYEMRQLFWVGFGLIMFLAVTLLGYRTFLSLSYLIYLISILLLIWVMIAGHTRLGAQRWISLGPVVIQPSEFAKLATVLTLAHFLGSHNPWEKENRIILTALALAAVPLFLIMKQPDLGTSLLFIPMIGIILFMWGIRYRYVFLAALTGLVTAPVLWHFLKAYQKKRILVFLNPNLDPLGAGYTALQSRIAVGSGGLLGKGYLAGTQSQLNFVPEHHTDFIFCVIGEEWGYWGSLLLIVLYGMLFRAIFQVIRHTTDLRARLLGSGLLALLFSQVFINIGMSIGLMPITGLTLPLVSYGGSSFLATSIALGLILSIHRERSIF